MADTLVERLIDLQIKNIEGIAIRYATGKKEDQEDVLRQYNRYIKTSAILDGQIEGAIDMLYERLKSMYDAAESDLMQGFYNAGVKGISEYRACHPTK